MSNNGTEAEPFACVGYIGGSILDRLLARTDSSTFQITTLVRSEDKAGPLRSYNITPVIGSFDDLSLIENLAANADVVFDAADADNLDATKAFLRGFKRRYQVTGKPSIFIHTSGTGLLSDNAAGMYATTKVWNDADADDLETLPDKAPHRNVDLAIIDADKEGFVQAYLVAPSTIYGLATGQLVKAGVANNRSMQIPSLIRAALDRSRAGMIGEGLNIWPNVHIDDVADLYMSVYDAVTSNRNPGRGREGYYFGENGEHTLYDVATQIGNVLVRFRKSASAIFGGMERDQNLAATGIDFARIQFKVQGEQVKGDRLAP
ncbi:hypothetical protein NP233_g7180 [Leucocoprinus birnbaumii]|uniref:NAD(P)-binding domain-containing protein n=1 Tax=Leucocoprinus birnbaumii TaxID=56174 RepID=A0AAD5VPQ8_9AGAR|nr:hypothetical protein NP233_g7180 [Leucocoprinus birnbaumii]